MRRARPRSPPLAMPSPSRCVATVLSPQRAAFSLGPRTRTRKFEHVLMVRGDGRVTKGVCSMVIGMPLDRPVVPKVGALRGIPHALSWFSTAALLAHPSLAPATGSTTADTMVVTQPLRSIVPLSFVLPCPFPHLSTRARRAAAQVPPRKRL